MISPPPPWWPKPYDKDAFWDNFLGFQREVLPNLYERPRNRDEVLALMNAWLSPRVPRRTNAVGIPLISAPGTEDAR